MHKLVTSLHPKNILTALDAIDAEAPSYSLNRAQALRRVFITLATVSVCLLFIHYLKHFSSFNALLQMLSGWQEKNSGYLFRQLSGTGFLQLIAYVWWTFCHLIGYVLMPFIVIKYLLKQDFYKMGWQFNETKKHWQGYLLLLTPILFCIVLVSQGEDFVRHYPFYRYSSRSWFDLLAWEFLYLIQFLCLEFFFRGFILNALRPALGANAVWIMCVPYLMIHFPKLWLEATGAILFGLFLGILALRSRSIWGGFFVHAGVAVSMDIASLLKQGKIPSGFWPF